MERYTYTFFLVVIVVIIGLVKGIIFFNMQAVEPDSSFFPDSTSYTNTARAFLETGRFSVSPEKADSPQIVRTPGYPFFIACVFYFFGETYPPLIFAQILLSLGTFIVVYHMASLFWGHHVAIFAVILLAMDIPSLTASQHVLTETLFTFTFSLALLSGLHSLKNTQNSFFWAATHGLFLALATLIRPMTYYLIFLELILLTGLWKFRLERCWRTVVLLLILFMTPWLMLVGGWKLRNYSVAGSAELSNIIGWNLLFCRAAGIIAERDNIPYDVARRQLGLNHYATLHPETKDWSIAQLDKRWKHEGLDIIMKHPGLFLKSQVRGFLKMMAIPGEHALLEDFGLYHEQTGPLGDFFRLPLNDYIQKWVLGATGFFLLFLFAKSYLVLFYLGVVWSLWQIIQAPSPSRSMHLFIWTVLIYVMVVSISGGPEAYFRFRIPMMPFLSIYAGHGIISMTQAVFCKKRQGGIKKMTSL